MELGEYVVRKSYGQDIIFRVQHIEDQIAVLKGIEVRLLADAPLTDLVRIENPENHEEYRRFEPIITESARLIEMHRRLQQERNGVDLLQKAGAAPGQSYFEMPGKVLHLDGDQNYLRKSMAVYGHLKVPAEGYYVPEDQMAETLYRILPRVRPNVVVITGHDGLLKNQVHGEQHLSSYKNSQHFVSAVQTARQYDRDLDRLAIIAGACQSHFEALLQSGSNFASSPARVLIHALDPVYIASKISYTSIKETVRIFDVIRHTTTGIKGLGGIETRGSYRIGMPKPAVVEEKM